MEIDSEFLPSLQLEKILSPLGPPVFPKNTALIYLCLTDCAIVGALARDMGPFYV